MTIIKKIEQMGYTVRKTDNGTYAVYGGPCGFLAGSSIDDLYYYICKIEKRLKIESNSNKER